MQSTLDNSFTIYVVAAANKSVKVVIKADIEGAELKIIPDMVVTGAFGHIDNLHMEWHGNASYRSAHA